MAGRSIYRFLAFIQGSGIQRSRALLVLGLALSLQSTFHSSLAYGVVQCANAPSDGFSPTTYCGFGSNSPWPAETCGRVCADETRNPHGNAFTVSRNCNYCCVMNTGGCLATLSPEQQAYRAACQAQCPSGGNPPSNPTKPGTVTPISITPVYPTSPYVPGNPRPTEPFTPITPTEPYNPKPTYPTHPSIPVRPIEPIPTIPDIQPIPRPIRDFPMSSD